VVADHVVAVDDQAVGRLADGRAADPEEHVVQRRRVGGVVRAVDPVGPTSSSVRVGRAGVEEQAGDLHAVDVGHRHRGDAVVRDERRQPRPSTTVLARVTLSVWLRW
jgi:hypothetical protein